MKPSYLLVSASAAILITTAVLIKTTAANALQEPIANPPTQGSALEAPTNLKVLPKDLTGQQVQQIMEQWKAELGASCSTCHQEDRERIGPDGQPGLNFAGDAKPMKAAARTMYQMTDEINSKYVARIDNSGIPVTCGTCHRAHIGPEPFTSPAQENKGLPPAPPAALKPAAE